MFRSEVRCTPSSGRAAQVGSSHGPRPTGHGRRPSTRDVIDRKGWCRVDRRARSKVTRGPETTLTAPHEEDVRDQGGTVEIVVTGRHVQIPDRFREQLDERLAKVPALAPKVHRIDVVVTHERVARGSEKVEITCHAKGPVIRAEACLDDKFAALDAAVDKLMDRLRRVHDKRQGQPRTTDPRVGRAGDRPHRLLGERGGAGRLRRRRPATTGSMTSSVSVRSATRPSRSARRSTRQRP